MKLNHHFERLILYRTAQVAFEQEEVGRQGDVDKATPELYMLHATASMETLLDNTLNIEHTWLEGDTTCALCQDDDTVSDADKVCSLSLCILLLLTVFDRLLLLFSHPAFSFLSCLVFSCHLPHITLAKRHIVDLCRCPAQIRSASPPYCFWIQKNQWLYRGMLDTRILPSFEHVLKHADRHVHDAKLCRGLVESSSLTQASTKYSLP